MQVIIKEIEIYSNPRIQSVHTFLEMTRSLCSQCMKTVDAKILKQDNRIILKKWCSEHGYESCLLHSNADWYLKSLAYHRPGDKPLAYSTEVLKGCPNDCGICPDHEQHTCLGLIDITDACNLSCPTCFSDSSGKAFLSPAQINSCLDTYIEKEGQGGVIQFSGGEPTLHPDLVNIVKNAVSKPIDVIMINTNGIEFANNEELVRQLSEVSQFKLEVYLQFDSFDDSINRKIRGADLHNYRMKAIENLRKYAIPINLVSVIKRGVNEDQIGKLVEYGVKTKGIRAVNFQPEFYAGRTEADDLMNRVTNTEIIEEIEKQTKGMFKMDDFIPLPCSHPSEIAITYAYIKNGKVKPIPRFIDLSPYMDQFSNTIYTDPRPIYQKAIKGLWSASSSFSSAKTLYDFSCVCGIPVKKDFFSPEGRAKIADENAFRIILLQFQDKYNWDMKVAKKCCVGYILPNKKIIPFDTYNVIYRNRYEVNHWVKKDN